MAVLVADVAIAIAGASAAAGMSALGAPGATRRVDVEKAKAGGIAGASAMTVWRAPSVPGETWLPAVKQK